MKVGIVYHPWFTQYYCKLE